MTRPRWLGGPREDRSDAPPVLFVHIMKTGGTTIARSLRETFGLDEIFPYRALDIRYDDGRLDIQHHLSVPYLLSLPEEARTLAIRRSQSAESR